MALFPRLSKINIADQQGTGVRVSRMGRDPGTFFLNDQDSGTVEILRDHRPCAECLCSRAYMHFEVHDDANQWDI